VPCRVDDTEAVARTCDRHGRMPLNVTGTPAIAVPTGFSAGGLPLGMQIATRAFDEAMLYRIAHAFCAATGLTEWVGTANGPICAVPYCSEINGITMMVSHHHESRVLFERTRDVEDLYAYINGHEGVVHMVGEEIMDWYAG
jgi:hypothetical protein